MPSVNLFPDSKAGTFRSQWTLDGGANKVAAVTTDDGDTSRIKASGVDFDETFFVDALPAAANIVQVDHFMKVKDNSNTESVQHTKYLGTYLGAETRACTTAYAEFTSTNTPRPGGGNWIPADFPGGGSGAEWGVRHKKSAVATVFCTYGYYVVEYTPPAGGYMWLLQSWTAWLTPFAGAAVNASELWGLFKNKMARGFIRPASMKEMNDLVHHMKVRPAYG